MSDAENTTPGEESQDPANEWAAMLDAEEQGKKDEPAAASATAASADAGGEKKKDAQPARVLNQDEIDTLLGFDTKTTTTQANTGIFAILDKALSDVEQGLVSDETVKDFAGW